MTRAFSLGLLACALAGCGTVQNFARPEDGGERPLEVYGGVTRSVGGLNEAFAYPIGPVIPLCVSDVALSAVADTVTLPITLPASIRNSIRAYYFPKEPAENTWRDFWFPAREKSDSRPAARTNSQRDQLAVRALGELSRKRTRPG